MILFSAVYISTRVNKNSESLKSLINCKDKDDSFTMLQHGKFQLMKNYVKAEKYVRCHESITYTTHADVSFLNNTVPLLERFVRPFFCYKNWK